MADEIPPSLPIRSTVLARARREPEFRAGMLTEALQAAERGEEAVASILLQDWIDSGRPEDSAEDQA